MNYTMVGRIGCTYCDMAKELIKANGEWFRATLSTTNGGS